MLYRLLVGALSVVHVVPRTFASHSSLQRDGLGGDVVYSKNVSHCPGRLSSLDMGRFC